MKQLCDVHAMDAVMLHEESPPNFKTHLVSGLIWSHAPVITWPEPHPDSHL